MPALIAHLSGLLMAFLGCGPMRQVGDAPVWTQLFIPLAIGGQGSGDIRPVPTQTQPFQRPSGPPDAWRDPGEYAGCDVVAELDDGADGQLDWILYRRYNEFGLLYQEFVDAQADDTIDSSRRWLFDTNGWLRLIVGDGDADGLPDQFDTLVYANDKLVQAAVFSRNAGLLRLSYLSEYEYEGSLPLRDLDSTDGTGLPNRSREYVYGVGGLASIADDYGCDGTIDSVQRNIWQDGHLIRAEYDSDADGDADSVLSYDYNERGLVTAVYHARPSKGEYARVSSLAYEDHGWLSERRDYRRDGSLDATALYAYDDAGRIVSLSTHQVGYPPRVWSYTNICPR